MRKRFAIPESACDYLSFVAMLLPTLLLVAAAAISTTDLRCRFGATQHRCTTQPVIATKLSTVTRALTIDANAFDFEVTRMKRLLDPSFKYIRSSDTDLSKTFERVRRDQAAALRRQAQRPEAQQPEHETRTQRSSASG
jgi:hypothetical protein